MDVAAVRRRCKGQFGGAGNREYSAEQQFVVEQTIGRNMQVSNVEQVKCYS